MLKFRIIILTILCSALFNISAFSQKNDKKGESFTFKKTNDSLTNYLLGHDIYSIGYTDDSTHLYLGLFKRTMPKGFNELSAPRFVIIGNNHKFMMGIGGRVLVNMGYGFNNDIPKNGFVPAFIPTTSNPLNNQRFIADAGSSRLVFRFLTTKKKNNSFEALIETDFNGNGTTLRLRKAYLKFMGFKIGKDYSIFVDNRSVPSGVDTEGPNGVTTGRTIMLTYSRDIYKGLNLAVGVENPESSLTYVDQLLQQSTQRIPDIPISLDYDFKDKVSYLKLAAVFKGISYYSTNQSDIVNKMGWGVTLSGNMKLTKNLTSYFGSVYGNGIGKYINDLSYLNYDMMPTANGDLSPVKMLGYHMGLKYDFKYKISVSAVYSEVRVFENNTIMLPDYYELGRYLSVDCIWKPIPALNVGLGYIFGQRGNFDNSLGSANRVMAMVQYNF